MSKTLTLVHAGWASVQALAKAGRRVDALARVTMLLTRSDVPGPVAADAHRLAAELLIDNERFAAARRHLRAAAALEPCHARTHYLTGVAFERDPDGCDHKAAGRYRKASRLDPADPLYRAAFGRAAVRCDRVKLGVRELLAAADAAPANLAVIRVVTDGLLEAGKVRTARRVLTVSRFQSRGRDWDTLWNRVRFAAARAGQRNTRRQQEAVAATDGDRVFLPFLRVMGSDPGRKSGAGIIRRDRLSVPRPHFTRLRATKSDR